MKAALLILLAIAASLFLAGKYNGLVRVRRRLITEALMLDFLVRRTLHLLPDLSLDRPIRHEIEQLALAGSADPLAHDGAARILAAAERLRDLMEASGREIPPELSERITFCRNVIPAYQALPEPDDVNVVMKNGFPVIPRGLKRKRRDTVKAIKEDRERRAASISLNSTIRKQQKRNLP